VNSPERILVSPLRFIGDGILTVPLLRGLRQLYPAARIDLLLPTHMRNLFEFCPYINEIVIKPKSKIAQSQLLREKQYDVGILMRRTVSQAFVFRMSGVKQLIGFDEQRFPPPFFYQRWGWFLDHTIPFPPLKTDIPQVKTYLRLMEPLGPVAEDEHLELWADEDDHQKQAERFQHYRIDTDKPLAMLHGTSASREKGLDQSKFIPALQALAEQGFQVLALGTKRDKRFYHGLAQKAKVPIYNLCGETTLRQSYAAMQNIDLLLSLDSAPIHMAVAAKVPHIIGIYGATNERQWRPYPYDGQYTPVFNQNLTCRPCIPKVCSHNRCREDLTDLQIAEAVLEHLKTFSGDHAI
jgi:heptosyltransferase II